MEIETSTLIKFEKNTPIEDIVPNIILLNIKIFIAKFKRELLQKRHMENLIIRSNTLIVIQTIF